MNILIAPMWDWNVVRYALHPAHFLILIAPMWDWNTNFFRFRDRIRMYSNCTNVGLKFLALLDAHLEACDSNCTNVGLKYARRLKTPFLLFILIAPMWDWNQVWKAKAQVWKAILIAPMWDWNFRYQVLFILRQFILIAPMWDWNNSNLFNDMKTNPF